MNHHENSAGAGCFIGACLQTPTHMGEVRIGQWALRVYLCSEHHRELEKGTPMSGLAADPCRIQVEATSASPTEQHTGLMPVSPQ